LYYRAGLFIHELAHWRWGQHRGFRIAWNLLAGIPFFMPSFTYYTHLEHHRRKLYGTQHDGEYLPFSSGSMWLIVGYLAQALVVPPLVFLRFAIVPATWVFPSVRRWLYRHASSLVIDPTYLRPAPTPEALRIIRLQEAACFLWIVTIFAATAIAHGRLPYPLLIQGYLMGAIVIFLNSLRTLVAHRYLHGDRELTTAEQLLDSTNFPKQGWLTELWAPVGLRYHALHHLLPAIPYHNLGRAHRLLMEKLPADSIYRQTEEESLIGALVKLRKRMTGRQPDARVQNAAG
jgi:fatty acid desaturase